MAADWIKRIGKKLWNTTWYLRLCWHTGGSVHSWGELSPRNVHWSRSWVLCWQWDRTIEWRTLPRKARVGETDPTKDTKSSQSTCDEYFSILREKDHNIRLIDHHLLYQPTELTSYVKDFNFQYSDITDEGMILLIDMLVDAQDVYA